MGNSPYSTLILIVLMALAFYLLIVRPNKKRQLAQQQTMSQLVPGTRVLLTSGIFGTLVEVGDKQAVLELSPGVHLTVLKPAIARTVRDGEEDTDLDGELADDLGDDDLTALDPTEHASTQHETIQHETIQHETGQQAFGSTSSGTTSSHALDSTHLQDGDVRVSRTEDPYPGTSTTPLKD